MAKPPAAAREAALYVLGRCRRFSAWSQQTLDAAVKKYTLDRRDTALCSRLCLLVLQNAALCDFYIDSYSSQRSQRLEPQVRDILRLGVVQLLFMDKIPPSAAVSEAVEEVKRTAPRAAGLVNAVLRRIAENREALPPIPGAGSAAELAIRYSHPLWLCEKLVGEYGYDHAGAYLEQNNRESGLTLSVNLCRTSTEALLQKLGAAPNALSRVSLDLPSQDVTALPGFAEGEFFVQDAAAAAAVLAADPQSGMRVLDACAAPGGKSFLCASLMGDQGEIISCDLHAKKLDRLAQGAERLGFRSIRTAPMDASRPYESFRGGFDLVLADAPCSGLGVIRKKPEIRYKDPEELRSLPPIQRRILDGAAACVRPGGVLVYSTCTILREENQAVSGAFLADHPEFTRLDERTIWPQDYGSDGFYYCKMGRHA
ncbi:MAG: 16S rRNA (cytosine(967)-C(5))-methyltransferase RsmB [Oscillospiraceae bacterium]|nr:16S rRNA (cytosine(967)-C(5))-methyltransferase RsmB [Oscillospiraceae bacterium]